MLWKKRIIGNINKVHSREMGMPLLVVELMVVAVGLVLKVGVVAVGSGSVDNTHGHVNTC